MKTIGILTGGADCPGLNAVIRAVVVKSGELGYNVLGFRRGWQGLLDGGECVKLDTEDVEDIHMLGGTILRTSRANPFKYKVGAQQVKKNLKKHGCDGLIVIGGDDTLNIAYKFSKLGVKLVGVPKTIDNDVSATDYTFGFDTAVNIATEALDRLHTTAQSHERVLVVEIMGHHAGWITLHAGIAGGAHMILIPEVPIKLDWVCDIVKKRKKEGKDYTLIAIAESAQLDEEKKSSRNVKKQVVQAIKPDGIASRLAEYIEKKTGIESRSVVLGHLQRGGSPSTSDRVLGTRLGIKAVDMVHKKEFGKMASLKGTKIVTVPLAEAVGKLKKVDPAFYKEIKIFFG